MAEVVIKSKKYGNKVALIDDGDFERFSITSVYLLYCRCIDGFYVRVSGGINRGKLLHRLIVNAPNGAQVDHVNRDTLDNRKDNLRICSQSDNLRNQPMRERNLSGFKGVDFCSKTKKFRVQIQVDGRKVHGGYFGDIRAAAIKYNELSSIYHGEFGYQNKV